MKIGVVGLGYVGMITAAVLSDQTNSLICLDIDETKIKTLKKGKAPIFEPGLEELLTKNQSLFKFTSDYSALSDCEAIFVAVATPDRMGEINLDYVFSAMESLKVNAPSIPIAVKSTVIPGTADEIFKRTGIRVVSNPEFLREGSAIEDTIKAERVVIGGKNQQAKDIFKKIWEFTNAPVIDTSNENAELIKYASNAFLATKISFINEVSDLCEKIPGGDVNVIAEGMGLDKRIAPYFLKAGLGYGGSCFPKDTQAIASYSRKIGSPLTLVETTVKINNERVGHNLDRIEEKFGSFNNKSVCVLGLAFKDNTDDLRSSKAWELTLELQRRGAKVSAFDPIVKNATSIKIEPSAESCMSNSDLSIVATEWEEFKGLTANERVILVDLRGIIKQDNTSMTVGLNDKS